MLCKNCNKEIGERSACNICGYDPVKDDPNAPEDSGMVFAQVPAVNVTKLKSSNGAAIAGFILMFFSCIPPCGFLSLIFAIIGFFKAKNARSGRALSIITLVVQVLSAVLMLAFVIIGTSSNLPDGPLKEFFNTIFFG